MVCSEDFVRKHGLQGQAVEIVAMVMATDLPSTFNEKSCMKMVTMLLLSCPISIYLPTYPGLSLSLFPSLPSFLNSLYFPPSRPSFPSSFISSPSPFFLLSSSLPPFLLPSSFPSYILTFFLPPTPLPPPFPPFLFPSPSLGWL